MTKQEWIQTRSNNTLEEIIADRSFEASLREMADEELRTRLAKRQGFSSPLSTVTLFHNNAYYYGVSRIQLREISNIWVFMNDNLQLYCHKDRYGVCHGKEIDHETYRSILADPNYHSIVIHGLSTNFVEIKNLSESTTIQLERFLSKIQ